MAKVKKAAGSKMDMKKMSGNPAKMRKGKCGHGKKKGK